MSLILSPFNNIKEPLNHTAGPLKFESPTMALLRTVPVTTLRLSRPQPIFFRGVQYFSTTRIMSGISEVIIKDHREIEKYYNNILAATDNDDKTRWQNQFVWELARHSIGEELVVYPAMEKSMGDKGTEMAEKDRQEHQVVCLPFTLLAWPESPHQTKKQPKRHLTIPLLTAKPRSKKSSPTSKSSNPPRPTSNPPSNP